LVFIRYALRLRRSFQIEIAHNKLQDMPNMVRITFWIKRNSFTFVTLIFLKKTTPFYVLSVDPAPNNRKSKTSF
jgi:hypothetical protein